ncbi:class I adenylate-forming enzyme family protein [Streptomyces sp. DT171]|uniref:class I adenylate-forming enzyme family protein n=1 Tax=Streptomyces sp. DT171 TaxID=3416524 RepID=UPI003CF7B113
MNAHETYAPHAPVPRPGTAGSAPTRIPARASDASYTLLHEGLDVAALTWPGRPALTCGERTLSYRELADASLRAAHLLRLAGAGRGDRVVVSLPNALLGPVIGYAASRIGAVFCLLHEQVGGTQLHHVLTDSEPALLISDSADVLAAARRHGVRTVPADEIAATALDPGAPLPDRTGATVLGVDPLCMIYTSGSTALPKAVVSTHQQVVFAVRAVQQVLRYRADDIVYCPLPLSFDYGLYQVFLAVESGAHLWIGRAAEAGPPLLSQLIRSAATVLPAVPAVAGTLARLLSRPDRRPTSLRLLTNTGAAMPPQTVAGLREALPGLRIHLMFGLTECKRATIMPADGDLARPYSSGKALPGTEVFVVDDDGKRLPPGETGQITVRGPHVMAGYWRRPELTAERFHHAGGLFPELRTGDYGWLDEEGYLYFTGRRDDLYKVNGFRVSATEVEAAARHVEGVESAAVLPPDGPQAARLYITGTSDPRHVLDGMREHLEDFKIPARCTVLDALPLNSNGKVDRKALTVLTTAEETRD